MRLIDADKLIDHLEKVKNESASLVDMAHIIGFQSVIDAQTTAYDVDAVVKQLEEVKKKNTEIALDDLQRERCFWYKQAVEKAIEIVKGGVVDGN